jgi:hypothetical protein
MNECIGVLCDSVSENIVEYDGIAECVMGVLVYV